MGRYFSSDCVFIARDEPDDRCYDHDDTDDAVDKGVIGVAKQGCTGVATHEGSCLAVKDDQEYADTDEPWGCIEDSHN